ncbi:hypothetical protein BP5796_06186 [Coleophoma crateriformis]|uniref:Glycosyl hydrolase family 32 N-terminal domain-containing protein n=1 Tax=Coleophoma crateriformis TaxID=565419 RepID=A0A3D8RWW9_9HELO|nr:hypothetical protein BP5796_06186 [Coleophoma crateriformis]
MPPLKNFLCAGLGYLGLHSQLNIPCHKNLASDAAAIDTTARRSTTASISANMAQRDVAASTVSYSDPWRPQVHFTPPQNFMNDPNGLFRDEAGLFHMYYQYAPTINPGYLKEWGHATSKDLYTWINQPIAIPGTASPLYSIFSGSIVVDVDNTSGLFPNQRNGVVAIYTAYTDAQEAQAIAYSTDGGYTFTQYAHNPVISLNQHDFRDPKVTWHAETGKWIMVVSHAAQGYIAFYTSHNLIDWTQVSTFSPGVKGVLECPQLQGMPFRSGSTPSVASTSASEPDHFILSVSVQSGGANGGGVVKYFPGTFNGTTFTAFDSLTTRVMDFGPDAYATAFFYDMLNGPKPLSMSWAVNLQYATAVPSGTSEGWISAMSVVREHYLANLTPAGYDLVSEAFSLLPMAGSMVASEKGLGNGGMVIDYSSVASGAVEFKITLTAPTHGSTTANASIGLDFTSSSSGESVSLSFNLVTSTTASTPPVAGFSMDRSNIKGWTTAPLITSLTNLIPFASSDATASSPTNTYKITGIMDRTILETFINDGVDAGSMIFFPTGKLDTIDLKIDGLGAGASVDFQVLGLKSGWAAEESKRDRRLRDGEDGEKRVDL